MGFELISCSKRLKMKKNRRLKNFIIFFFSKSFRKIRKKKLENFSLIYFSCWWRKSFLFFDFHFFEFFNRLSLFSILAFFFLQKRLSKTFQENFFFTHKNEFNLTRIILQNSIDNKKKSSSINKDNDLWNMTRKEY